MISIISLVPFSPFAIDSSLTADDGRSGDRFGYTVALDGDQLAIAAVHSSSVTTSSWDFENGTLAGWVSTGNAFNFQPTFGDNTYLRPVYRQGLKPFPFGSGQHSHLQGRYFIGTFEKYPGNPLNFVVPDLAFPQGNSQGDNPMGTLTSQTFIIRGETISLLVGGGCDELRVYVELLVDGYSVARVTGRCSETMAPAYFNVSNYLNRSGQIRIVDASSLKWGHINVDDIRFDWEVEGSAIYGTAPYFGGLVETPLSGAVYLFRRYATTSPLATCLQIENSCKWIAETKLTASDKRSDALFGTSLALNDKAGILVVGAPHAAQTGLFKENPNVYPSPYVSTLQFPLDPHLLNHVQYESLHSGASSVWFAKSNSTDVSTLLSSGAIYIFVKKAAIYGPIGIIAAPQQWYPTETAKFQPSDVYVGDSFGYSLAIDGMSLAIGSPGQDAAQNDAGAAYFLSLVGSVLSFSKAVYIVYEGHDDFAKGEYYFQYYFIYFVCFNAYYLWVRSNCDP
jgi:hypothetical protein